MAGHRQGPEAGWTEGGNPRRLRIVMGVPDTRVGTKCGSYLLP